MNLSFSLALLLVGAAPASVDPVAAEPAAPLAEAASTSLPATPAPAASAAQAAEPAGITVTARTKPPAIDPLMRINEKSYAVVQDIDVALVAPLANGYKAVLPGPLRTGLRNGLRNMGEPVVALSFLLQLKPVSALKTVGRFAVNTSMGFGGLVDVAKTPGISLPYRANGFANTMGYYGIGSGPYFFLPIIGPITLRDGIGLGIDRAFLPAVAGRPFNRPWFATSATVIRSLDDRIEMDEKLRELHDEVGGGYAATRRYYLERRQAEIDALRGKRPVKSGNP